MAAFENRVLGGLREDWFVNFVKNLGLDIWRSSIQDFLVKWVDGRILKFEVGGKNKKIKPKYEVDENFFLVLDDVVWAQDHKLPLWVW